MHATIYRDGVTFYGAGVPAPYTADGTEPVISSNGMTYYPTQTAVDLSGCNDVRIACHAVDVSGTAGVVTLSLEYYEGHSWHSANASVTVTSAGMQVGVWASLPQGAQADRIFRIVTSDETGNGGAVITPLSITLDARP